MLNQIIQLWETSDTTKTGNKPFSNIGVDYFGSIIFKFSKRTRSNTAKAK